MMELTRELNREGRTIILVTHSMWLAAAYADRVIVMREGKVILDGPTRKFRPARPACRGAPSRSLDHATQRDVQPDAVDRQ